MVSKAKVPELNRWNSIMKNDAYVACSRAQINSPKSNYPGNYSFRKDGTLKDAESIKKTITSESGKFFMNLDLGEALQVQGDDTIPIKRTRNSRFPDLVRVETRRSAPTVIVDRPTSTSSSGLIIAKRISSCGSKDEETSYTNYNVKSKHESVRFTRSSGTRSRRRKSKRNSIGGLLYKDNIEGNNLEKQPPTVFTRKQSISKFAVRSFDYNDPDLAFQFSPTGPVVMGGTKEKLIALLCDISIIEIRYIIEFLGVYPYFASCNEVLETLSDAFHAPKVPSSLDESHHTQYGRKIQRRVLFVMTRWLQNFPRQFYDASCVDTLQTFLESIGDEYDEKATLVDLFQTKVITSSDSFSYTKKAFVEKAKSPLFMRKSDIIAQQLCLLDQKQFCKVEICELKGQAWNGENANYDAPNTTRCIEFFNRVSYWCATEIISRRNLRQRIKVFKRVILIAYKCMEYKNYNSVFAIVSALNFSAVSRLKLTWKALPHKYMEMYLHMNDLCCVQKHYIPYKRLISIQTPPLVPYLGVFLRDLTFIEVGNPTYIGEGKKMVNYDKFRMLAVVLEDIRKYQQIPYEFEHIEDVQTTLSECMLTLDEDELYLLSQELEPPIPTKQRKSSFGFVARLKRSLDISTD